MAVETRALDPVTLEVLWNRLLAVVNEQQIALMRTAFSTIVRESQDLACGVFDTQGRMLAQSMTGTPGHINAMATGVKHFLRAYPPDTLAPGDVLITNDPWLTAGQINDLTVLTPVFRNGELIAFFANTCHAADIGGRILSAEAREVFEEGLRIPITKLMIGGEPNHELLKLLRANVRTPDEVEGDLHAQMACNDVAARSLLEMMDEFGLTTLDPLAEAILDRSERAMRQAIRTIPNGVYRAETWNDGFEEPVRICVTVTVEDEDITIDFTGSSPQSRHGINVVFNYTHAYASFALKAAVSPEVPHNDGSFRPVHVRAEPGSILHALEPAPVGARHLIGHFLPSAIYAALVQAIPDRVLAPGADAIWISVMRGRGLTGRPFTLTLFQAGGMGARPNQDGLNNVGFPSGVAGVPAEVIETVSPLVLERREIRPDSGGPGRWRGGCGQHTTLSCRTQELWTYSGMIDRLRFPAPGVLGGGAGARGELVLSTGEHPTPKAQVTLRPDQQIHLVLPGGGGREPALERPPERVLADVIEGYVTPEGAARDYGVVVRCTLPPGELVALPEHWSIDYEATAALRRQRAASGAELPPDAR
jgi:N-methylhydantoinase B